MGKNYLLDPSSPPRTEGDASVPSPSAGASTGDEAAPVPFTVYSTPWCGYCTRLKRQLKNEGLTFAEVDIELDREAEAIVKAANHGNATVPTLVFSDGTSLTNPTLREVLSKIEDAA
jgi:mycoredoxin